MQHKGYRRSVFARARAREYRIPRRRASRRRKPPPPQESHRSCKYVRGDAASQAPPTDDICSRIRSAARHLGTHSSHQRDVCTMHYVNTQGYTATTVHTPVQARRGASRLHRRARAPQSAQDRPVLSSRRRRPQVCLCNYRDDVRRVGTRRPRARCRARRSLLDAMRNRDPQTVQSTALSADRCTR